MPDHNPPRLSGGEREVLLGLLQFQRDSLLRKIAGTDPEAARRPMVASGTTLLWLLKHLAQAEILWLVVRFAGQEAELPDDAVRESDTVASVSAAYRAATARSDAIAAAASLDEPCKAVPGDEPLPLRWVLMHLLEETARHAGHADILREQIDGSTGR